MPKPLSRSSSGSARATSVDSAVSASPIPLPASENAISRAPPGLLRSCEPAVRNHVQQRRECKDNPRARSIDPVATSFYANVLEFLRVHHGAEDALLWPLLRERAPEHTALLDRMDAQHAAVEEVSEAAQSAVAAYAASPTQATATALVASLRHLLIELDAHLVDEEREILPLAAVTVSQDEWGSLPGWAMSHFAGDKVWLVFGLLFEEMNDEQVATTLAHMPAASRATWAATGETAYRDFMSAARGLRVTAG